jgi:23S rRNA (uracil1939-C5)-methyltransferase
VGSAATDDPASLSDSSGLSFLPITQCPIAAPILWRTAEAFLTLIDNDPNLWRRNPQFKLDQLELFTSADESALQLTLYLRTGSKALPNKLATTFAALCQELRIHIPELTGAGISLLPALFPQRSRRAEQPHPGPSWGSPGLNYTIPAPKGNVILSEAKGKNPRI